MQRLPSGLVIFNATPHPITFWDETWLEPVVVEPDTVISAAVSETEVARLASRDGTSQSGAQGLPAVTLVTPRFEGTEEGRAIIRRAREAGADLIIGSIIAAQAYPGEVVAMIPAPGPAPGYERQPSAEERMRPVWGIPDRFTIYSRATG